MYVCVCVCEREREKNMFTDAQNHEISHHNNRTPLDHAVSDILNRKLDRSRR